MDDWDEIRTAYQVARIGTVSGAAEMLGVHHATVIRHIDALEGRLGVKLFQRHARGYTTTEAGDDLLRVAQATDDQFTQLASRLRGTGEGITGELVVTSLASFAPLLVPVLGSFQAQNPGLIVRYLTGVRLFRLEYGEAHVAIRAGAAPDQPDNVVQPFLTRSVRLMAARSYIERHGLPAGEADLANHWFVANDSQETRAPFNRWLRGMVPLDRIIFRSTDELSLSAAVRQGIGIGFIVDVVAENHPDLVEIMPPRSEWQVEAWIVTHVDLHRSAKVQSFLAHLKAAAKEWTR